MEGYSLKSTSQEKYLNVFTCFLFFIFVFVCSLQQHFCRLEYSWMNTIIGLPFFILQARSQGAKKKCWFTKYCIILRSFCVGKSPSSRHKSNLMYVFSCQGYRSILFVNDTTVQPSLKSPVLMQILKNKSDSLSWFADSYPHPCIWIGFIRCT